MKLPQLLAQYLYQTKSLNLPGIGSFQLDPGTVIPEQTDKPIHSPGSGIVFRNATIHTPDDPLIEFIKAHTGKMKPLAAADLDFFLTTGKQLLNIGKPFYLEGIGTLIKNMEGKFDFTPGEFSTARLDEPTEKADNKKTTPAPYEEPRPDHELPGNNVRQVLLLVGIIGILIVIGWGGYYLYKKNTYIEPAVSSANTPKVVPDSTAATPAPAQSAEPLASRPAGGGAANLTGKKPDSLSRASTPAAFSSGPNSILFKFIILETTKKNKALRRYNQLLGYQLNIKMDEKDSSWFKLYFPIYAENKDTSYIKDSLATTYAAHVSIERK